MESEYNFLRVYTCLTGNEYMTEVSLFGFYVNWSMDELFLPRGGGGGLGEVDHTDNIMNSKVSRR